MDKVKESIQIHFSKKQKIFFLFYFTFLKSERNFEHFEKNDNSHGLCSAEIRDCERRR